MPHRLVRRRVAAALAALLAAGGLSEARGDAASQQAEDSARAGAAALPFAPGERASYQVRLGGVAVGSGSMQVVGIENVHGKPTYHTRFRLSGGIPLARVDDRFDSWIDVEGLFSRRFRQDQNEVNFERNRTYEFFPERREYRRLDNGETGRLATDRPLDDISFIYFARTLPLAPGETYTLDRYFKADRNPVVLKVLRRETITVPAGTFRTVVVRPIIKAKGLFGEGGQAEVFLTDDARRIVVQIRSRVPVIGSLTMSLREYQPGAAPGLR